MSQRSKKENLKKNKTKKLKKVWPAVTISFGTATLLFLAVFLYNIYYQDKIFPRSFLGETDISGWTQEQVTNFIKDKVKELNEKGLFFSYGQEKIVITPTIVAPEDPDASYEIIDFKEEETLNRALAIGRSDNFFQRLEDQFSTLVSKKKVAVAYTLNEKEFLKILKTNFSPFENPAQDAELKVGEDLNFEITEEKTGETFKYEEIIALTKKKLENLSAEETVLALSPDYPEIKKAESINLPEEANDIKVLAPFKVTYEDKSYEVTPETFSAWLALISIKGEVKVSFNQDKVAGDLKSIAGEVLPEAKEGKFRMENGRVAEFQASQTGRKVDKEKMVSLLETEIVKGGKKQVALATEDLVPAATLENINNLGIKELIGRGESDFKGSPRNRIHNINVGAASLNGILIKPGEEFSLVKALGEISAKTGYLPELVIKGNKTIPEYGGGLCQIGTTTFRVALDAGLPITERQSHSYRVVYYEPAGVDATIYDPKPDFKFINDTGHYILFQTKIEGTKLIFEFYGTRDGRKVEMTKPRVFNLVSPAPAKIVETEDLPPGEKKCTEKAHTGADAEFTRIVTKVNGENITDTFKSHYKPWQEVCLVGKAKPPPESG